MPLMLVDSATRTNLSGTSAGDIFQLVAVLVVLVLVIVAAYFLTRWIAGGAFRAQKQAARMQVVDRLMLAKDRAVVVVELGEKYYMLGVGTKVTLLDEVDGAPYRAQAQRQGQGGNFFSALQDRMKPKSPYEPYEGPVGEGHTQQEDIERAIERMRARTNKRRNTQEQGDDDEGT